MKLSIPTIPTLLSLGALLSVSTSSSSASTEVKSMIRRNAKAEKDDSDSTEPEVAGIVNGKPTGKALPYQVALSRGPDYRPECSGSLIAPRVVLTAASCVIHDNIWTVKLNMYNAYDPYDVRYVNNEPGLTIINLVSRNDIIIHPEYKRSKAFAGDIALVILPVGVEEGEYIKYAKLNEDHNVPSEAGERLFVSGWGRTVPWDRRSDSDVLVGTELKYVPAKECAEIFDCGDDECGDEWWCQCDVMEEYFNTPAMCARKLFTDVCDGDGGGPLVLASETESEPPLQVGIVSIILTDCYSEFPNSFTRVSTYVDWIRSESCEAVGQLC